MRMPTATTSRASTRGCVPAAAPFCCPGMHPCLLRRSVRYYLTANARCRRQWGTIRFVGETVFAIGQSVPVLEHGCTRVVVTLATAGPWVGVELDKPMGKNDGSVRNMRVCLCYVGPLLGCV